MTENKEMKTEQENSKLQLSVPGPRVDYLYDNVLFRNRVLSKIPLEQISRIQLGQTDQVINCSLIGGNNIEDVILMNNTYKKDEVEELLEWTDQEEWWTCKKCDKNIMESVYHQCKYYKGEYHKKYCNSTKEKHKHKLIPDYSTKRVKDKCCFRCGKKGHYIIDCKILKKKTIVIVHKEILMNQWIEKIPFVLSGVKIGIVQGDKCEIENLSPTAFDDIGHVIIDECHK